MSTKQNTEEYNQWWEDFNSINAESPATIYRHKMLVKKIRDLRSKDILDAGCGSGELIISLLKNLENVNLSGFDVSTEVINQNKRRIKGVKFFTQDLTVKANPTKFYDLVLCSEVIEHLKDWKTAIYDLAQFTKKSGYVIVTTQSGTRHHHHLELGHLKHFTLDEINSELKKNGLRIVESFYSGWPFMNFQYLLTDMFYKKIEKTVFKAKRQSLFMKLVFGVFNFLYPISSKSKGPQIFIVAKK